MLRLKNKKNMTLKAPIYSKQHLVGFIGFSIDGMCKWGQTNAKVSGEFTSLFHMNYQSFINSGGRQGG